MSDLVGFGNLRGLLASAPSFSEEDDRIAVISVSATLFHREDEGQVLIKEERKRRSFHAAIELPILLTISLILSTRYEEK